MGLIAMNLLVAAAAVGSTYLLHARSAAPLTSAPVILISALAGLANATLAWRRMSRGSSGRRASWPVHTWAIVFMALPTTFSAVLYGSEWLFIVRTTPFSLTETALVGAVINLFGMVLAAAVVSMLSKRMS